MTAPDAREILVTGSHALARADDREQVLVALLEAIADPFEIGSAAVVVPDGAGGHAIGASIGLDAAAGAGLAQAIRQPGHPIAHTFADPVATYDVAPVNPGGPALRSHLPLVVRHDRADHVVGVLALAYDRPIENDQRPILEAVADLAAVAIDRLGPA
jgi:GAF domain-containing protein